jgi:hypothetical protein
MVRAALDPRGTGTFALPLGFRPAGARGLLALFGFVETWVRDLAAASADAHEQILNVDARDYLVRVTSEHGLSAARLSRTLVVVEEAREQAMANVNPQLIVAGLVSGLRTHFLATTGAGGPTGGMS